MSYMDQKDFAPTNGIQEMSFDEIDQVGGGPAPIVVGVVAFLNSPAGVATIAAVGAIATATIAYVTTTGSDDCVTHTYYGRGGRVAKTVTTCS